MSREIEANNDEDEQSHSGNFLAKYFNNNNLFHWIKNKKNIDLKQWLSCGAEVRKLTHRLNRLLRRNAQPHPQQNTNPKGKRSLLYILILCIAIFLVAASIWIVFKKNDTAVIDTNAVDIEMVFVRGGTFTMGCTSEQGDDCFDREKPAHQVTLSDFSIGKYEVTQAQWKAIMGSNPSSFKGDNLPVENVSWNDVQEFIRKLNEKTGKNYRLPTEAEWEYAARGGASSSNYKYSGSNNIGDIAWYTDNSESMTHPVGTKQANELGIYDMSGNVWEWCQDWRGNYSSDSQTNPRGPASGAYRVNRGGSWYYGARSTRVSYRDGGTPDIRDYDLGFRLALGSINEVQPPQTQSPTPQPQSINIDMVYVRGGTFTMGCTSEQGKDCYPDENPAHQVALGDFAIGKYEVTQAQWTAIMGTNPSYFKGDDLPVEKVSWNDVQEFIRKLNAQTGKNYRLPTEAEWEYAARGGANSRNYKYSGSNNIGDVAWYKDNSESMTHPVGSKQANELGIYDMNGNVFEWCQDWYGSYNSDVQTNPLGPASGSDRVYRGGSWASFAKNTRVSFRSYGKPDFHVIRLGFRLALGSIKEVQPEANSNTHETTPPKQSQSPQPNDVNIDMVYVRGGTFTMGCTSEQRGDCGDNEQPAHKVTLSAFSIGKYEVTQAQWESIMGSNPSNIKGYDLPVENVNWNEVQEFIRKLNAKTGKNYRLPTEAEWEYAARGGASSKNYKYSGSNNIDEVAWHDDNSGGKTHPVGSKRANELGIYDMNGSVWEWCQDWYGDYSSDAQTNPLGPASGFNSVVRGGGYYFPANIMRVSIRGGLPSDFRDNGLGFRLALGAIQRSTAKANSNTRKTTKPKQSQTQSPLPQSVNIDMVYVRGGTFTMGCTSEQGGDCYNDEKPAHKVTLSDFYIGKYEVTQAQWKAIMGSNPSYFKGDNLPVENVSWDEVQEFIRRLNTKTGKKYRLPTEAEWEYAARGGSSSRNYTYSGSNNAGDVAWYGGNSSSNTHPVGSKRANKLGIYDMSGNVWEWCQDYWGNYSSASQTNPRGPASGAYRVSRGGCWNNFARNTRVSSRADSTPYYRSDFLGFRLASSSK